MEKLNKKNVRFSGTTIVGCWGDRIQKQVKEDVEVLEPVPRKVLEGKYRVLNLREILQKQK